MFAYINIKFLKLFSIRLTILLDTSKSKTYFSAVINRDKVETKIDFICNQSLVSISINPATSTLDFIRKNLNLTGTKEGCHEGDCGACTVLVGELIGEEITYKTINSCLVPIASLQGKHLVTIEGLNNSTLTPIQNSFVKEGGSQCGFCTPGFIVSLTGSLLNKKENYSEMIESIDGNICRCTGYSSIKNSIKNIESNLHKTLNVDDNYLRTLVENNFLPEYFLEIPKRLKKIIDIKPSSTTISSEKAYLIAGGTDIFLQKENEILEAGLNFIEHDQQQKIWEDNNYIFVKAYTTVNEIQDSLIFKKYFPEINSYFNIFGSHQIRNKATLGGNIVNASPIGDMTVFFLSLNPTIRLKNGKSFREILLKNFFKSYKTLNKEKDEILDLLYFPIPSKNSYTNFEKVSRRKHLDIASVNTAVHLVKENKFINNISVSAGGVAPYPLLLIKTSDFLIGNEINCKTILEAVKIAQTEIAPISDVRGSKEYKSLLLRQLLFAHFLKLFPEQINEEELYEQI